MKTLYSYKEVDKLISRYLENGGEALQLSEGTLGSGNWILYDNSGKLKTFIINEVYINEWSSGHTVRAYNRFPEKYKQIVEKAACMG